MMPPMGTPSLEQQVDQFFGDFIIAPLASVFFWEVPVIRMPLVVGWLFLGSIYFTVRMGFVSVRMFGHAIELLRGKYDNPHAAGEMSHFQALTTALSATVGLGNIAGVAIAIATGGPGATLWMMLAGFLGMSAKFTEVTLGQIYRHVRPDGSIMGGAMYYLSDGLAARGLAPLGRVLAVAFVILCIGGSFGNGNSFQVKQGLDQIRTIVPVFDAHPWAYGLVMVVLVGIVIIGICDDASCRMFVEHRQGAALASAAMAKELSWFPYVLGLTVFLFSYSSMISWSYYGERCWTWLFGERVVLLYRLLFLAFTFLGSIVTATNILEFSDLMVLGMAFPNILGAVLLSGVVARSLAEYRRALAAGEVKPRA
jgi:Na+/alanine symporter